MVLSKSQTFTLAFIHTHTHTHKSLRKSLNRCNWLADVLGLQLPAGRMLLCSEEHTQTRTHTDTHFPKQSSLSCCNTLLQKCSQFLFWSKFMGRFTHAWF